MKNKIRVAPKATKGKGNRWRKGESSNCNAANKKYRQRVNLLGPISKSSFNLDDFETLRLSSINLNDPALIGGGDKVEPASMDVDQKSVTSFNSFASIYTDCTNVSFNRILDKFNSASFLHKEMIALLATLTEVIKEKGGTESDTEYFALLTTLLETTDKDKTLAAIAYLLGMIIRNLPDAVKQKKFTELCSVFTAKLLANRDKNNGYLLINLIRCLSELIKSQDKVVMKLPSTFDIYTALLDLTLDSKPKIRRSAHRAVISILKTSKYTLENTDLVEHHVLAEPTAKFCVNKFLSTSVNNINDALHTLNLMKDIISIIPSKALKICCEAVTRVSTISHANPLLVNGGLSVFLQLFNSSSPLRALTPQFNYILLNRLKDCRPSYTDSQLLPLWVGVMKEGYISLYSLDKTKCLAEISSLLSALLPCFESDSKMVHITVTTSIQQVIQTIIAPSLQELDHTNRATIGDVLEDSLQFKYQNAWGFVCSIIAALIEHVGKQASDLVIRFIKKLIDLREGYNTNFEPQIDMAIGKAIKNLGPQLILDIVPLERDLTDATQFNHSWLIPLLRDNIEKSQLKIFEVFFIPLADRIKFKIAKLDKVKQAIAIKLYSTLHNQIWSLFTSFCREPTDIKVTFNRSFHDKLKSAITKDSNINRHYLAGLRNLIKTVSADVDKNVLKSFTHSNLGHFISLYTNPEASKPVMKDLYGTIRVLLTITDEGVRDKACGVILSRIKGLEKHYEEHKTENTAIEYLNHCDIILLFIPFFLIDKIEFIYKEIICPMIEYAEKKKDEGKRISQYDKVKMRKIIKIIQEICCNPNFKEFIPSHSNEAVDLLVRFYKSCPDRSKYLLINSLDILFEKQAIQMEKKHVQIMLQLIIDCVETGKEKGTSSALKFLVNLPKYLSNTTFVQKTLIDLIQLHSTGLKPAEILVLGHGIFDLDQEELPYEVRSKFFQMLDLFKSDQKTIVRAVFQVINLWVKKSSKEELQSIIYNILMALNNLSEANRSATREAVKVLLTKLVRKLDYDFLSKMVPTFYEKVLRNIRKSETRKANARNKDDDDASGSIASSIHRSTASMSDILDEDSDDDSGLLDGGEDEDERKSRASSRKSRKARSETFIEEKGDEEEIIDLLDPNINSKIHSSNPMKANVPKLRKKEDIKMTEDGKIDFTGMFEKLDKGSKRKRDDDSDYSDDDEDYEDMDERASKSAVSRKSAKSRASKTSRASKVSATTSHGTKSSYQPGGKGIHRPVKKRKTGIKGARTGEEFASRKAGGDVKKKDSVDPYAYVPINGALLNRRKKNKFKNYFNKIITTKSKSSKGKNKS